MYSQPNKEWESFTGVAILSDEKMVPIKGSRQGIILAARHIHAVKLFIITAEGREEVPL